MGKWKTCELGNLIKFQRGHDLPKSKMVAGKYPVVGSNGIIGWHNEYTTEAPSITVGRSGNVGNPFIYYGRTWSHNTTLYIKEYKNTDPVFIYYFLKTLNLSNYAGGSAVPTLNRNHIHTLKISVPETIEEQHNIGIFLKLFDDKIQQNIRINKNLEEQLMALFSHSFAEDIAAASTDTCSALGDLVVIIDNRGKTPPLTIETFDYPIIDVGALKGTGRIIDFNNCTKFVNQSTYKSWFRSGHPKPWDILISTVGSLAEMKIFLGSKGCVAQNVVALRATSISPLYLYQYLRLIRSDLVAYNIGSVQPSIKVTHIVKHPIFVPERSRLEAFEKIAKVLTNQLYDNYNENELLKKLRDALLPRLMSGEINASTIGL